MQTSSLSSHAVNVSIETSNLEKLLEFADESTLILSDISNTLYKPCNMMSAKMWRTYFADRVREVIMDPDLASKIANSIENIIVNRVDKQLVHAKAPTVIRELQDKKIPFIAISLKNWAAPYDPFFGITTSNHLKKLEIDLEKSVPLLGKMKDSSDSNYEHVQEVCETAEYTFAKGIIFTSKKPLDTALDAFLTRLESKPRQIIILENSDEHKEKLETVIKTHHISLVFVKHTLSEDQESSFDATLGTIEFLHFMKDSIIILDEEAKRIKEQQPSIPYETLLKDYIKEFASSK